MSKSREEQKELLIKRINIRADGTTDREALVIAGIIFYKSTGQNSTSPGTYFPFCGISTYKHLGTFLKPSDFYISLESEVKETMQQSGIFSDIRDAVGFGYESLIRWGTITNIIISSLLGGGVWETKEGKEILTLLQETYPDFYKNFPKFKLLEVGQTYEIPSNDELERLEKTQEVGPEIKAINDWLSQECKAESLLSYLTDDQNGLPAIMFLTPAELLNKLKPRSDAEIAIEWLKKSLPDYKFTEKKDKDGNTVMLMSERLPAKDGNNLKEMMKKLNIPVKQHEGPGGSSESFQLLINVGKIVETYKEAHKKTPESKFTP